ncbi:MAG TPA: glycine--tRNA ligase [Candidatus Dormibacteraeota bacterium]|nr:glycine--tRNA ligase [Candidatus Dormibacteraeota bacterium]
MQKVSLETLASLCKRRGFIYQGSELYGGMAGTWDYGPLGIALKRNIVNLWWQTFVEDTDNVYGLDSTIIMNQKVWEASGHVATFSDQVIEDVITKKQYRLDHLLEDNDVKSDGLTLEQMLQAIDDRSIKSPEGNNLGKVSNFNLMFKTNVGSEIGNASTTYLRPETAQGTFLNYKNIVDSFYPNLPFGIAQIGRNFRNEISPRDYIFRSREFEIMEFEYFIKPENWEKNFDILLKKTEDWYFNKLNLSKSNIRVKEIGADDRAHYSKRTIDFEYNFSIGFKEIGGIAYRSDFDLNNHQKLSGKNMEYIIKGTTERLVPHVIEPTFGLDRNFLAVLVESYREDEVNGEKRVYLSLPNHLAPIKVAVFPLLKNKPEIVNQARKIYKHLKKELKFVDWDDSGNIGKRYRKQDEIGTPFCVTIDYDSLSDNTVTIRDRDSTKQKRLSVDEAFELIKSSIVL